MDRTLPPSESKLEALRLQGVVPQSQSSVRLAGCAGVMGVFAAFLNGEPLRAFFSTCTHFGSECRMPVEGLVSFILLTIGMTVGFYLFFAIMTNLSISRYYFRVAAATKVSQSRVRNWARIVICIVLGVGISLLAIRQIFPPLFALFNHIGSSGYTAFYSGILSSLRSALWLTCGVGLLAALALGFSARVMFRNEHAMSKEELMRENRG